MKKKNIVQEAFKFQDLTEEEKQRRGILGRLVGPCASISIPTRNGRFYQESLWDNQFETNDILKELIENGGIPMELDHPVDRDETCSDRIAAMMPELPKKDDDGHLICYVDIIDTPMGQIAYSLAKYGFNLGISSRGNGDVVQNELGEDIVDPNTFDLTTFDLVLIPAVKDARLSMTESLNNKKNLKQALQESLDKANASDRKLMEETLDHLGIKLNEGINTQKSDNINKDVQTINENLEVEDNKSNELVKSLKETLMSKVTLEKKLQELQEQLAASDTRAKKLEEELHKHKDIVVRLSSRLKENKDLKEEVISLKEQLDKQTTLVNTQSTRIEELKNDSTNKSNSLNESISLKNKQLSSLQEKLSNVKKVYEEKLNSLKENVSKLNESIKSVNTKNEELTKKLSKSVKLVEKYKNFINETVDRYIKSKAIMLGITPNEIKNRLNESYSIDDIDNVCDSLQSYNLRISELPFKLSNKDTKIKVTESKASRYTPINPDDDISDLVEIAGLK